MTTNEFRQACELAFDPKVDGLFQEDTRLFDGFGLSDFTPIVATLRQVASVIRYQCSYIFGDGVDAEAKQSCFYFFVKKRRVVLVG